MAKNIITDATEMLYKQAQRLYDADKETIGDEVERSKALDGLVNGIRQNIGTQLAVERFRMDYGRPAGKSATKMLEG